MAKKKQNLKPDIILKNYWSNNEQFADLFNAVLFEGRRVIQPEELEDVDTEESTVLEHREYAESIKASRDNIKVQKKSTVLGVQFVMLGLESQEHIHYAMPMRVMGFDYGSYLHIPEEMKKYVNDYKMLLVEARKNDLILHNINNKDLFNLLEILLNKGKSWNETKEKALEYAKEHKVEKSVVMTVAGAANCKIDYNAPDRKGESGMYTVFEETRAEGKAEGRAEEIVETGYEFGLSENDILERLQKKLNVSLQKAQEYLKMFGKQAV